jgi:hypothetical protein
MGVHGNGLTALLWMKPSLRSTVMEFFYPEGFAQDYEFTTRALGMVHYGFWNDKCAVSYLLVDYLMIHKYCLCRTFTSPSLPTVAYPPGFQGNDIPIDGVAVARLCVDRLTLSEEADD